MRRETPSSSDEPEASARIRGEVAVALATFTLAVLPAFLLGGLANQVRADLRFGEAALGAAVAVFWAVGALGSSRLGRFAESRGASPALRAALLLDVVGFAGVGALARSWPVLAAFMALCGVANAIIQPAVALYLTRRIPTTQRGRAFGFTLAAIPLATLLAGLAVPTLALTVGWRWAFVGAAVASLAVWTRVPRQPARARTVTSPAERAPVGPLVVLAVGAGLAAAATGCLGSFLVQGATARGLTESAGGWLLVIGSLVALGTRLVLGFLADRGGRRRLQLAAAMLIAGVGPIAFLGVGRGMWYGVSAAVSFALAWGWPGLFNLALVELAPASPAHATGVAMTGTYLGGVVGPPIFGYIAESASYRPAWAVASAWALAAGLVFVQGNRYATRPRVDMAGGLRPT